MSDDLKNIRLGGAGGDFSWRQGNVLHLTETTAKGLFRKPYCGTWLSFDVNSTFEPEKKKETVDRIQEAIWAAFGKDFDWYIDETEG